VSVEGDKDQARLAWKSLGGGDSSLGDDIFTKQKTERFNTKFIEPPSLEDTTSSGNADRNNGPYVYEYQGEILTGTIVDRVFEMESRLNAKIPPDQQQSETETKNKAQFINSSGDGDATTTTLKYETTKGATVSLAVVERTIEKPNENGFGHNELVRITTAAGGLVPGNIIKAARVKRRFRRGYDKEGNRIVEGLEIVKTFRVLDGVAGDLPTSTTKSQIQFSRPSSSS